MLGYRHHRGVSSFHGETILHHRQTSLYFGQKPASKDRIAAQKLLSHSRAKPTMRQKANISSKEKTASIIPTVSPSRPVVGGDENAAMSTTTSAKLITIVAMNWKADAAWTEGHGWAENATWVAVSGDRCTMNQRGVRQRCGGLRKGATPTSDKTGGRWCF